MGESNYLNYVYPPFNYGAEFEQHGRTGRPLGSECFIERAERFLKRDLKKKKPGPKNDGDTN